MTLRVVRLAGTPSKSRSSEHGRLRACELAVRDAARDVACRGERGAGQSAPRAGGSGDVGSQCHTRQSPLHRTTPAGLAAFPPVRRLDCSQRRRGFGVVGGNVATSGILGESLDVAHQQGQEKHKTRKEQFGPRLFNNDHRNVGNGPCEKSNATQDAGNCVLQKIQPEKEKNRHHRMFPVSLSPMLGHHRSYFDSNAPHLRRLE